MATTDKKKVYAILESGYYHGDSHFDLRNIYDSFDKASEVLYETIFGTLHDHHSQYNHLEVVDRGRQVLLSTPYQFENMKNFIRANKFANANWKGNYIKFWKGEDEDTSEDYFEMWIEEHEVL